MKFILNECFRTIKKAKLYFLFSVVTTTIGVFLIQSSYVSRLFVQRAQMEVSNNLTVQLYLKDLNGEESYTQLEEQLKSLDFIKSYQFVSKQQAEEVFLSETGEDFRKILDYNPLPASYKLQLQESLIEPTALDGALNKLRTLDKVTEVGFAVDLYKDFLSFSASAKKYLYLLTIVLVLVAIYIVTSFSIATIDIRHEEIRTMRFIGSSRMLVAAPILINSSFVGFLGAIFSTLLWYKLLSMAGNITTLFFEKPSEIWLPIYLTALSGVVIGFFSGGIALLRSKSQM